MKTILLSTLILFGFMACKSKKGTSQTTNLENSSWEVVSLLSKNVTSKQTLIIVGEQIHGQGACNKYSAKMLTSKSNIIKISDVLSTKMGCENLNEEQLFFENMRLANSYKVSKSDELTLYNSDKLELVKLKKIK